MNFKGKTVVITGASSGIGLALAYEFAALGANLVLGARTEEKLKEVADELDARGVGVAFAATDVTRQEDCRRLIYPQITNFC